VSTNEYLTFGYNKAATPCFTWVVLGTWQWLLSGWFEKGGRPCHRFLCTHHDWSRSVTDMYYCEAAFISLSPQPPPDMHLTLNVQPTGSSPSSQTRTQQRMNGSRWRMEWQRWGLQTMHKTLSGRLSFANCQKWVTSLTWEVRVQPVYLAVVCVG
jgi:hypothetical protein